MPSSKVVTHLARRALVSFLLTFITVRVIVFLIMSRRIPDFYLHLGGSHIHHLNYGIFLLAGVGAYLLFQRPSGRGAENAAVLYGIGMALTFDEFGMWVRLGGGYWQRASLDAITVISAAFGLLAYAPSLKRFRPQHWISATFIALAVIIFFLLLAESFHYAGKIAGPRFHQLELFGPQ
jgi:hypothetical protein